MICLFFGFWHPFLYGHVSIWNEFRSTFLAPAFFTLFPTQMLLFRPKLVQSSTFFSWLRLSYPLFRAKLMAAIETTRVAALQEDVDTVKRLEEKKVGEILPNVYRSRLAHLYNLFTLMEFCIPVLHDYGVALKSTDFGVFHLCYLRLFLMYLIIRDRGSTVYRTPMFVFLLQLMYWIRTKSPISTYLHLNHTIFSEECGEIALSMLANLQPSSTRGSLLETQKCWQLVKLKFDDVPSRLGGSAGRTPLKKYRLVGTVRLPCVSLHLCCVSGLLLESSKIYIFFVLFLNAASDL